jgi:outer membrane autotransporter protein
VTPSTGDKDSTSTEPRFTFHTIGITGGLDYEFADHFWLGLALGYTDQDAKLSATQDTIEADDLTAALYATYSFLESRLGSFSVDFTASGGRTDYSQITRTIRYVTNIDSVDKTASADTDATHYALALGVNYEFHYRRAYFGPHVMVNYLHANIDGFRECGADEFNLDIGDQTGKSLVLSLGGQFSYIYPVPGTTLQPHLRAEWRHEFENNSRLLTARFINAPSGSVAAFPTDAPDRDYCDFAVGVVATFAGRATVALEYETLLGLKSITNNIMHGRLRIPF